VRHPGRQSKVPGAWSWQTGQGGSRQRRARLSTVKTGPKPPPCRYPVLVDTRSVSSTRPSARPLTASVHKGSEGAVLAGRLDAEETTGPTSTRASAYGPSDGPAMHVASRLRPRSNAAFEWCLVAGPRRALPDRRAFGRGPRTAPLRPSKALARGPVGGAGRRSLRETRASGPSLGLIHLERSPSS
jgi:hypothetical protein